MGVALYRSKSSFLNFATESPLAIAVLGGVAVSMVLSLFITPVAFLTLRCRAVRSKQGEDLPAASTVV
jgi:hypothetical protein